MSKLLPINRCYGSTYFLQYFSDKYIVKLFLMMNVWYEMNVINKFNKSFNEVFVFKLLK